MALAAHAMVDQRHTPVALRDQAVEVGEDRRGDQLAQLADPGVFRGRRSFFF